MSDAAQREWWAVGPIVVSLGTVTGADLPALGLLARLLASEREATEVLGREGMTVTSEKTGITKGYPALSVVAQARAQAHRLLADFGMTPRGRNYVSAAQAADADDPLAKFFQPA